MSYYKLLGMEREPFSTSPDPTFFFLSECHKAALCRLQIAISLRRGVSLVLGDVGTGKTTLSRKLAMLLKEDEKVSFHMILNPYFKSEKQFLSKLATLFHVNLGPKATAVEHIEAIERFLFTKGVEERRIVTLLIDEAQILPDFALEILRILLNYETNEYKILQLVLMGQMEILERIRSIRNFWDRIAVKYVLNPLNQEDARQMIRFRLTQAGYTGTEPLFIDEAVRILWEYTQGYPRRLSMLCHNALEYLVMYDRRCVDEDVAKKVISAEIGSLGSQPDDVDSLNTVNKIQPNNTDIMVVA